MHLLRNFPAYKQIMKSPQPRHNAVHVSLWPVLTRPRCAVNWQAGNNNTDTVCRWSWRLIILRTHTTIKVEMTQIPCTVYPKKYAHGFCFAVLCCGYILTDFPISIRLTSLALWQSNDCPSASKATLMNMDKYFTWIHYERLHNHNKAKHNKTVCIFLGIYCIFLSCLLLQIWIHILGVYVCSN